MNLYALKPGHGTRFEVYALHDVMYGIFQNLFDLGHETAQ